jgi:tetratricopeptide (TPR) repeat protein
MTSQGPLSGQLEGLSANEYPRLRAQLRDLSAHSLIAESQVNPLGSFEFASAPSGTFELQIVNWQGDTVMRQSVSLPFSSVLRIKIGDGSAAQARIPISLTRLQHKVPKKAFQSYASARKALASSDRDVARRQFENSVKLDPMFFEATNDLGVIYLDAGRLSEAYEMFQRATTIDPGDPQAEANLAFVLLALRRFPEAEQAARSSVRSDSLSSRARFLLAVSLLEQRKSPKEALFHLSKAKEHFEPARKLFLRIEAMQKD